MSSRKIRRNQAKAAKKAMQQAIGEHPCSIEGCTAKSRTRHECTAPDCEDERVEWYNCHRHYPHVLKLIKEHVAEKHQDVIKDAPNAELWA